MIKELLLKLEFKKQLIETEKVEELRVWTHRWNHGVKGDKYVCTCTHFNELYLLWILFISAVGTSLLGWSMGPNVTVATASPVLGWRRKSVIWTAREKRALSVEAWLVCLSTRWTRFFLARGDVSTQNELFLQCSESSWTSGLHIHFLSVIGGPISALKKTCY